jgi:hypothetical protein
MAPIDRQHPDEEWTFNRTFAVIDGPYVRLAEHHRVSVSALEITTAAYDEASTLGGDWASEQEAFTEGLCVTLKLLRPRGGPALQEGPIGH